MTETERALRAALPGLDWHHVDDYWTALIFDQSYAQLVQCGPVYRVRVLGNAETCHSLREAVQWLRAHVVAIHARLGVALEGVK